MTMNQAWAEGEPALEDLLSDPIIDVVLRRDGLARCDVWRAVDLARQRLDPETQESSAAA